MKYEISGGDGGTYGDNFGPIIVTEIGILMIPKWNQEYMVLKTDEDLIIDNEKIEYLTVAPRYEGDDFNKIRKEKCIVGIGKIIGKIEILNNELLKGDVVYFAIGATTPLK